MKLYYKIDNIKLLTILIIINVLSCTIIYILSLNIIYLLICIFTLLIMHIIMFNYYYKTKKENEKINEAINFINLMSSNVTSYLNTYNHIEKYLCNYLSNFNPEDFVEQLEESCKIYNYSFYKIYIKNIILNNNKNVEVSNNYYNNTLKYNNLLNKKKEKSVSSILIDGCLFLLALLSTCFISPKLVIYLSNLSNYKIIIIGIIFIINLFSFYVYKLTLFGNPIFKNKNISKIEFIINTLFYVNQNMLLVDSLKEASSSTKNDKEIEKLISQIDNEDILTVLINAFNNEKQVYYDELFTKIYFYGHNKNDDYLRIIGNSIITTYEKILENEIDDEINYIEMISLIPIIMFLFLFVIFIVLFIQYLGLY